MIYSSFHPFLIHLWIGFVGCSVYHIVPSPDHHCPVDSCLTLTSFAANASQYLENNTLLIFQPGNHIIRSQLNVTGVVNFSMISDQSRADITCENYSKAEFIFNGVNDIYVSNLKFYKCFTYCNIYYIYIHMCVNVNLITLTTSSLVLVGCTFEDIVGNVSVISATHSNVTVEQSRFKNNYLLSSVIVVHIIKVDTSNLLIYDTKFICNRADIILGVKKSTVSTVNSTFKHNYGSAMDTDSCKVDIHNSVFKNNNDGALNLRDSKVQICGSEFQENVGETFSIQFGGAINCFSESSISFSETCTFTDNKAWLGGAIYLGYRAQCFVVHGATVIIANNTASQDGGGIYLESLASLTLHSQSMLQIIKNTASEDGGGIYLNSDSNLTLRSQSTLQILENRASKQDGGGIYLYYDSNITLHSQSILQILENNATNNGGGIYASQGSSISLGFKSHNTVQTSNSTIHFYGNRARKGGGLYFELDSLVYVFPCFNNIVNFSKNSADYGGAVYYYYEDDDDDDYESDPECFFQSETLQNPTQYYNANNDTMKCNKKPFFFSLNRANYLGFSLYKDAFSNCSIDGMSFDELKILELISNIQASDVGSSWTQLCYCENGLPDCSRQIPYINIKPEETLILDVAIVDRRNHRVTVSGFIKSEISGSVQIRDHQKIQDATNGCTSLIFNIIYAFEASQTLIMSLPIEEDSKSRASERSIRINFLACINCPVGFQQIKDYDNSRGCDCVCDVMKLESQTLTCNYTRETITRKGTTAWITFLSIKNTSDYLIYPYCPMDYCFPPDVTVEINLNIPNGADAQCTHNRSGLLCGACSPGLSLSLGSSCCLQCHTYWPGVLVVIVTSSLLAGLILVASLLMLNLTVAAGTLNGLIFYANIVAANQYKFFPSASFISVFMSWLNLELGIDTCFFDGMDFYWKTWIQLAFPAYILLLVVLVIIVSEYSVKFAQIVGKRNPIATMDTLVLFCYVKFLRTVIVAFSFATLDYPDGSHPVVWWPDATVGYFSGKHIILWAVAAIICLAGFFYTILLFFWQWLLYYQHKTIFKWMQSQRLRMFVEPYHAPYAFKHRYWTGLLLLVRVIVYIISAADVSGDHGITLLAIGIMANILLILVSCRPYKSWPVEVLEIVCYANIAGLCLATFYTSKVGNNQDTVGYISGTISSVLFLVVLTYHVVTQLFFKTQLGRKFKNKLDRQFTDSENEEQVNFVTTPESEEGKLATYSEVDPPPRGDAAVPLSYFVNLRSRRGTNDSLSESAANYEENELRPIEQEISSSTPYNLMK